MKISLNEIKLSIPEDKKKADPFWTNLVLRPLSIPVSWLFIRLNWSANFVTYFSIIIAVLGGFFLFQEDITYKLLGAVLFNLFAILDCADGNIARVTKKFSIYGGWVDALGGYIAYISVLVSAGFAAESLKGELFSDINFVYLGFLTSIANLLLRVVYQNYKNVKKEEAVSEFSARKSLSQNFGITGIMMPFIFIAILSGLLEYFVIFYFFYFSSISALVIINLVRKVEKYNKVNV